VSAPPKLSLVTSAFHESDLAFIKGWSERVPGIDGWRLVFDQEPHAEYVAVIPPGATAPVFALMRDGAMTVLSRLIAGEEIEMGRFNSPRAAILTLCALHPDELESLNEALEHRFPRRRRG
jgi:hypothetical protein